MGALVTRDEAREIWRSVRKVDDEDFGSLEILQAYGKGVREAREHLLGELDRFVRVEREPKQILISVDKNNTPRLPCERCGTRVPWTRDPILCTQCLIEDRSTQATPEKKP